MRNKNCASSNSTRFVNLKINFFRQESILQRSLTQSFVGKQLKASKCFVPIISKYGLPPMSVSRTCRKNIALKTPRNSKPEPKTNSTMIDTARLRKKFSLRSEKLKNIFEAMKCDCKKEEKFPQIGSLNDLFWPLARSKV